MVFLKALVQLEVLLGTYFAGGGLAKENDTDLTAPASKCLYLEFITTKIHRLIININILAQKQVLTSATFECIREHCGNIWDVFSRCHYWSGPNPQQCKRSLISSGMADKMKALRTSSIVVVVDQEIEHGQKYLQSQYTWNMMKQEYINFYTREKKVTSG